jgi:hypothetical protein
VKSFFSFSNPRAITDDVGTTKYHLSTAMRTAIEMHVAEILRDAGPQVTYPCVALRVPLTFSLQGIHARDIAKPTNVDPGKLGTYFVGEVRYAVPY